MAKKLTEIYVKEIIRNKYPKAILLSECVDSQLKLKLICEKGHNFQISFSNILGDHWCAECAGNKKLTIEQVKEKIKEKRPGTICNFTEYKDNKTKLDLICEKGHEYKTNFDNIKQGKWCPECSCKKKHTIEEVRQYVEEKHPGAIVISTEYNNNYTKLDLICENGHNFKIIYSNMQQDGWCAECNGNKKLTIDFVKRQIEELHPEAICNFTEYKNVDAKLDLICENDHNFKICFSNIKKGHWCPKCSEYKSEKYIRAIFEELTGKEFVKIKPNWLINDKTNWKLELDGFNEETKIAFECQGSQHYKTEKRFQKTKEKFEYQQYRDNLKKELCKINNVNLICVPAINVCVNNVIYTKKLIKTYIKEQLGKISFRDVRP